MRHSSFSILVGAVAAVAAPAAQELPPAKPNAAGDYHWTYVDARGQRREFTFVPATKIEPVIESAIQAEGTIRYAYTIANGASAVQKLRNCIVEVALPTTNTATPAGWRRGIQPNEIAPRTGWSALSSSENEPAGIAARGVVSGFALSSPALPGVVEFRCVGNAPERLEEPSDLPESVQRQLGPLAGADYVVVSAIGPAIAAPDDPLPVLLRRVLRNYRTALLKSNVLEKQALVQALEKASAIEPNTGQTESLRSILAAVREMTGRPQPDNWSADLAKALRLVVNHIERRLASM